MFSACERPVIRQLEVNRRAQLEYVPDDITG